MEKGSNSRQGLRTSVSEGIGLTLSVPSGLFSALTEGEPMLRLGVSWAGVGNMAHSFPGI